MDSQNRIVLEGELIESPAADEARAPAPRGELALCGQAAEGEATGVGAWSPIVPRVEVRVRKATLADLPFIDKLQKAHSRELGFLPRMALEGKVRLGQVLVAEEGSGVSSWKLGETEDAQPPTTNYQPPTPAAKPLGYLIAADRYFKRDEVGYITQINVVPEYRRSLVAAALLQAQFDRSAYGCRLYCCWCAQDLKANEFWEAMGFVPIAFRTGSRTKGKGGTPRIHIFWQKRIREGDESTPWWFPSQTAGGEMREDRLVFPIPPGVSWRDVLPVVLPGEQRHEGEESDNEPRASASGSGTDGSGPLPDGRGSLETDSSGSGPSVPSKSRRRRALEAPPVVAGPASPGGIWFVPPPAPEVPKTKPVKPKLRTIKRPRGPLAPGGLWFLDDVIEVVQREVEGEWKEIGQVGSQAVEQFMKKIDEQIRLWEEARAAAKQARAEKEAAKPKINPRLVELAREVQAGRFLPEARTKHDVRRLVAEEPVDRMLEATGEAPRRALPEAA